MNTMQRVTIGALGGLASGLVKFVSQDYAVIFQNYGELIRVHGAAFLSGYILVYLVLTIIGAIVGYVNSGEPNRMKLFFLAISAPALITTAAGGAGSTPPAGSPGSGAHSYWMTADGAVAQAQQQQPAGESKHQGKPAPSAIGGFTEGIKYFFSKSRPQEPEKPKDKAPEAAPPDTKAQDTESDGKKPESKPAQEQTPKEKSRERK
jgi:hypothetical protein